MAGSVKHEPDANSTPGEASDLGGGAATATLPRHRWVRRHVCCQQRLHTHTRSCTHASPHNTIAMQGHWHDRQNTHRTNAHSDRDTGILRVMRSSGGGMDHTLRLYAACRDSQPQVAEWRPPQSVSTVPSLDTDDRRALRFSVDRVGRSYDPSTLRQ